MNAPAVIQTETLPSLVDRAARAMASARNSAEVLEARDMARVAYDAAKSAGRMARAKQAHDDIIAAVYRAQADALLIEARAKMRLADEYDAAQDRSEVASGRPKSIDGGETLQPTAADLGIRADEIHEARKLRDAEKAEPGLAERALKAMVERGEEPTKAALRREMAPQKPKKVISDAALWLWGRLKDFERDGILANNPRTLFRELAEPMQEDVRRLVPMVRDFLKGLEE